MTKVDKVKTKWQRQKVTKSQDKKKTKWQSQLTKKYLKIKQNYYFKREFNWNRPITTHSSFTNIFLCLTNLHDFPCTIACTKEICEQVTTCIVYSIQDTIIL